MLSCWYKLHIISFRSLQTSAIHSRHFSEWFHLLLLQPIHMSHVSWWVSFSLNFRSTYSFCECEVWSADTESHCIEAITTVLCLSTCLMVYFFALKQQKVGIKFEILATQMVVLVGLIPVRDLDSDTVTRWLKWIKRSKTMPRTTLDIWNWSSDRLRGETRCGTGCSHAADSAALLEKNRACWMKNIHFRDWYFVVWLLLNK